MVTDSAGSLVARSKPTWRVCEVSMRPWPVLRRSSRLASRGAPCGSASAMAPDAACLRDGSGLFPLAVERDADHADVVGAPGARGVGIRQRREVEGRRRGEVLAPA